MRNYFNKIGRFFFWKQIKNRKNYKNGKSIIKAIIIKSEKKSKDKMKEGIVYSIFNENLLKKPKNFKIAYRIHY